MNLFVFIFNKLFVATFEIREQLVPVGACGCVTSVNALAFIV